MAKASHEIDKSLCKWVGGVSTIKFVVN